MSGTGKSNTAAVITEQLHRAGEQVVLIDPKGEAWGLQSSFDGRSPGLDLIVFGQPHGDIKSLREEHAAKLADLVVTTGRSIALSMLGFESDACERRFVTKFYQHLYRAKSRQGQRRRTLVVLDEAHLFAPEGAGHGLRGEMVELFSAIKRCVRQGRSVGLGTLLVDQRPQDVSKQLVSQSELLIIHGLSHNTDRKALKEWTSGYGTQEQQEQLIDGLATLQSGEAFVWSPAWLKVFARVMVDRRSTFDSGSTPNDMTTPQPEGRTKVDMALLEKQLAEVVEYANATDPKLLRMKIAQLQEELEAERAKPPAVDQSAYNDLLSQQEEQRQQLQEALNRSAELSQKLGRIRRLADVPEEEPAEESTELAVTPRPPARHLGMPMVIPAERRPIMVVKPAARKDDDEPEEAQDGESANGMLRLLAVIAKYPDIDRQALGLMSLVQPGSGTFNKYMSVLRRDGLIEAKNLRLTEKGQQTRNDYVPKTAAQRQKYWSDKFGDSGMGRIVRTLIQAYPNALTSEELASRSELVKGSGTYNKYMSTVRRYQLVDKEGNKHRAPHALFRK